MNPMIIECSTCKKSIKKSTECSTTAVPTSNENRHHPKIIPKNSIKNIHLNKFQELWVGGSNRYLYTFLENHCWQITGKKSHKLGHAFGEILELIHNHYLKNHAISGKTTQTLQPIRNNKVAVTLNHPFRRHKTYVFPLSPLCCRELILRSKNFRGVLSLVLNKSPLYLTWIYPLHQSVTYRSWLHQLGTHCRNSCIY